MNEPGPLACLIRGDGLPEAWRDGVSHALLAQGGCAGQLLVGLHGLQGSAVGGVMSRVMVHHA